MFKSWSTLISLILLFSSPLSFADEKYTVKQVADGIYYHQGIHQDPSEDNIGAIANVGFIIGDNCIAVIDSGGSYLEGTYLRQAIRRHTQLPICYVINSHVHPDHLLGNAAFKQDKPIYVGHEKLPAALAARQGTFSRVFKETLGKAYDGSEFIPPTLTVAIGEAKDLDLGNRIITLTAYSTSHTDHDVTVLDNDTNTFWTGDLLFMERIPVLDGSILGWLKTMEQLQQQDFSTVVPGHGTASNDQWQQGLTKQYHYFSLLRDQIRLIIEDLGTISQASKEVGLEEKDKWELFELYHRRNITASFVELEWE